MVSIDMEGALHESENEIEDENQLNLPKSIDGLITSFSNLKKIQKTKKERKTYSKKNLRFSKNLENC